MAERVALPQAAMTITPGYSWRLELDVKFDGERPSDWPEWSARMHIWGGGFQQTLKPGAGVSFEEVALPGGNATCVVFVMDGQQTEAMRDVPIINYLIDLQAPQGEAEDYFAGQIKKLTAPPEGMLT